MEAHKEYFFESVLWEQVRKEVKEANQELAEIIDALDPHKKLKLVKASYPFGDLIIKDGILKPPSCLNTQHISRIDTVLSGLDYSKVPLSLLLNKSSEVFITENDRAIPLKVFSAGTLFGTFEAIDYLFGIQKDKIWCVSAGSRNLFTLPRISESSGLRRLKMHYNLSSDTAIRSIADHWYLFKQIAQHKNFTQSWKSDVVFFTKDWLQFKKTDTAWFDFQKYLFKQAWIQSLESMTRYELALYWQNLIKAIAHRRIKPTPYFVDTTKHIILISMGEAPAFQPAINSNLAPIQGLQEAILNDYMLTKYFPFIMQTEMMKSDFHQPFYYSLSLPTLLEGSPYSKCNSSTIMLDLKHIKLLIETALRDNQISKTRLKSKIFEYFHVENEIGSEILSSSHIPNIDKRFSINSLQGLEFCAGSPFWRGCIMIRNVMD